MAGVPEINIPTTQPEALPTVAEPVPSAGAFGAHTASGLASLAQDLFHVGWEEHQRAAMAQAQEKETEFQKVALEIRDKYKNLQNMDAVSAHGAASAALEAKRAEISKSLTSRHALEVFNNNSLRSARFVQESIDTHFETQNRRYQKTTYSAAQAMSTRAIAALASDEVYSAKAVESEIEAMRKRALANAEVGGLAPKVANEVANVEVHQGTDALFKVLLDKNSGKSPDLVKKELDKYVSKGLVDVARQKDAVHQLGASYVESWLDKTMSSLRLKKVSHDKDSEGNYFGDPEGFIPAKAVQASMAGIPASDPHRQKKIEALRVAVEHEDRLFKQAGAQLQADVVKAGTGGDGKFRVPERSDDWQKYERLYPIEAGNLRKSTDQREYQRRRHAVIDDREAGRDAYGRARLYLSLMPVTDLKNLTEDQIVEKIRAEYRGSPGSMPSELYTSQAVEFWKKLKADKLDPTERQFNSIAAKVLNDKYKGNPTNVRRYLDKAGMMLEDWHREDPKLTADQLHDKLKVKANEKGGVFNLFDAKVIENYERGERKSAPPGKYPVPGYPSGRTWDGRKWVD